MSSGIHDRRKLVIGLAGGIASGKSAVAEILAELGAAVIDSDELVRREMLEPEVIGTYRAWWGDGVCTADGAIDRAAVANIIFDDARERARLEAFLFPRLERRRERIIAKINDDRTVWAIVLNSPLLYEAGLDRICDVVVFVDTERAVRLQRVRSQRRWTERELDRREKLQKPLDMKRQAADYRVENNSSPGVLRSQVETLVGRLLPDRVRGPGSSG